MTINRVIKLVYLGMFFFMSVNIYAQAPQATALGPINVTPGGLANDVIKIAVKISGGAAFLLMIYGGFLFITSSGDQQKLSEATEVITSTIAGLIMIIFSVFILELVGNKILGIF